MNEAKVQEAVRAEYMKRGCILWRNNVGSLLNRAGRPVRYGLANDSEKENKTLKSADLIGITPTLITPDMVGRVVGIFTSVECKASGWKYRGNDHERAQLRWLEIVRNYGGTSCFRNSVDPIYLEKQSGDQ